MELNGSQIIIEELRAHGVEISFGIPGGAVIPFFDDLLKAEFPHILTRHEQGAAHMADGYARVGGKIAAALATSGPGATNLITGLANAHMDSVPMIAITGQVATPMIGTDAFQEADIYGCSIPVTKHNWLIKDVRDVQRVVREAIRVATTGRPGPVLIDLPRDIQTAKTEYTPRGPEDTAPSPERHIPEPEGVERLLEALERSERPLQMGRKKHAQSPIHLVGIQRDDGLAFDVVAGPRPVCGEVHHPARAGALSERPLHPIEVKHPEGRAASPDDPEDHPRRVGSEAVQCTPLRPKKRPRLRWRGLICIRHPSDAPWDVTST